MDGNSCQCVYGSRNVTVCHKRHGISRKTRRCVQCSKPLSTARRNAKFCSTACRTARWHRRVRTARALAAKSKCETCGKRIRIGTRADARYCSPRCRQHAYRARQHKEVMAPTKAHQRLVRERLAAKDVDAPRCVDISKAEIRPISHTDAKAIIQQYEWLGTMPAVARHCFGIFFDGHCAGAVVYGDEYAENLGVWDRYGYTGQIISLARGACTHWAHPHSASKLIRRSMDLLPPRYAVVTATVDAAAGEIGTVYQAAGFDYVGTMRSGGRSLTRINGRAVSERQMHRLTGTRGVLALAKLGFDASPALRKGRYFAFRGSRAEREKMRESIAHLIKPYPRRTVGGTAHHDHTYPPPDVGAGAIQLRPAR